MNLINPIINRFREKSQIDIAIPPSGLFHFERHWNTGERSRIHLRIDPSGEGLLLVNASRVLHLNPTAAFMTYLILSEVSPDQAQKILLKHYKVHRKNVISDYDRCANQIEELIHPNGACPIHVLDLDVHQPFSVTPSAPYRMDLALTYRCNNDCLHCYNARPRGFPELGTSEWKLILDKLWSIGIPHIVFTGGEPTLRDDLPELIAHAEHNGQITGINTNGRRLSDKSFLQALVHAGLDHIQITLESHNPTIHDQIVACKGAWNQTVTGIRNTLATNLFVMTNTTLLKYNSPLLSDTLDFTGSLGLRTIGINALIYSGKGSTTDTGIPDSYLSDLMKLAKQKTDQYGQRLIWYTPTQYCQFDPTILDLGIKGCTAALYNMCIEPNGDVIPCQSYYTSLGNLRDKKWAEIWNHEEAIFLRERRFASSLCNDCALFVECGGGCPLKPPSK